MIDAWEIVGRLATDGAFENAVFAINYSTPYGVNLSNRANIPQKDYDALRAVIISKVTGPVSLMSLGELMVAMRFPNFKAKLDVLAAAIGNTHVNTVSRSPLFYTAVGAAIVDRQLRGQIADNFPGFGFALGGDAADARTIIKDAGFNTAAEDFCMLCWAEGCNLKTIFWAGHLHPIENPFALKF